MEDERRILVEPPRQWGRIECSTCPLWVRLVKKGSLAVIWVMKYDDEWHWGSVFNEKGMARTRELAMFQADLSIKMI